MPTGNNLTLSASTGPTKENRIVVVWQITFQHLTKTPGTATDLLAAIPEIVDSSNLKDLVPEQYNDLFPLFTKKGGDKLPPYRYVDYAIPLIQGKKPPMGRMY